MQKQIIVTIDRVEGGYAVLKHQDEEILWPQEELPQGVKEGDILALTAMTTEEVRKTRSDTAKTLINDILNSAVGTSPGTPPFVEEEPEKRIEKQQRHELSEISDKLSDLNRKLSDEEQHHHGR